MYAYKSVRKALRTASFRNRSTVRLAGELGTYTELNTTILTYDWRRQGHYDGENVWIDAHTLCMYNYVSDRSNAVAKFCA
jgi:hypothetical protein